MTLTIREKLEKREFDYLSDIATKSANSKGRKIDEKIYNKINKENIYNTNDKCNAIYSTNIIKCL